MATVKIKFTSPGMMGTMYTHMVGEKTVPYVRACLREGGYYTDESALFDVAGESKDAADEVFDLTNNPSRQDEREQVYGRGRSLSVGDIVVVGEEQWLCCSMGWKEL